MVAKSHYELTRYLLESAGVPSGKFRLPGEVSPSSDFIELCETESRGFEIVRRERGYPYVIARNEDLATACAVFVQEVLCMHFGRWT
jgi:hypothetical protein